MISIEDLVRKHTSTPNHILAKHAIDFHTERLTTAQIDNMSDDECGEHMKQRDYDCHCLVALCVRLKVDDIHMDELENMAIVPVPRKMNMAELKKQVMYGEKVSMNEPYWHRAQVIQSWMDTIQYYPKHADDAPWLHYRPTDVQMSKLEDWVYTQADKYDISIEKKEVFV